MRIPLALMLVVAASSTALGETYSDELSNAISRCWNVSALSTEAQRISIIVGFSIGTDGKPISDTIKLIATQGGESATRQAFEAARRAILRCGSKGFPRPPTASTDEITIEAEFAAGLITIGAPPDPTVEL